jgi:hypothetical protein
MKYFTLVLFTLISLSSFSQNYLLADLNDDKTMLANFIKQSIAAKKLKENPVIVVNEKVLKDDELDTLNFYKSDILDMSLITKNMPAMTEIYGEQALNGVVLIEVKPLESCATKTISDSKVLFLLNDKPITEEAVKRIDPNSIESVTVIKNKEAIAKYTTEQFDGVVIIELKGE